MNNYHTRKFKMDFLLNQQNTVFNANDFIDVKFKPPYINNLCDKVTSIKCFQDDNSMQNPKYLAQSSVKPCLTDGILSGAPFTSKHLLDCEPKTSNLSYTNKNMKNNIPYYLPDDFSLSTKHRGWLGHSDGTLFSDKLTTFYQVCRFRNINKKYFMRKINFRDPNKIISTEDIEVSKQNLERFLKTFEPNKYKIYSAYDLDDEPFPPLGELIKAQSEII